MDESKIRPESVIWRSSRLHSGYIRASARVSFCEAFSSGVYGCMFHFPLWKDGRANSY